MRLRPAALLALAALSACSAQEEGSPEVALAKRGAQVYQGNCTACHAPDPSQPGPVGPPIAGSSLELLRAKVLRNEYPPGYAPKRDTKAMIPLVHLEPELPAIAAFLGAAAQR
jgi:mono/diheme cytochrome c family protein